MSNNLDLVVAYQKILEPDLQSAQAHPLVVLQANFQALLVTDGSLSFAIFLYENLAELISSINSVDLWELGFDGGDATRHTRLTLPGDASELYFRIDGKYN